MASPIRVFLTCPKLEKNRRFVRAGDKHMARRAGAGRGVGVSESSGCGVRPARTCARRPRPGRVFDPLGGCASMDGTGRHLPAAIVAFPGRAIRSSLPRCFLLRQPENPASLPPGSQICERRASPMLGAGKIANGVRMGLIARNTKLIDDING